MNDAARTVYHSPLTLATAGRPVRSIRRRYAWAACNIPRGTLLRRRRSSVQALPYTHVDFMAEECPPVISPPACPIRPAHALHVRRSWETVGAAAGPSAAIRRQLRPPRQARGGAPYPARAGSDLPTCDLSGAARIFPFQSAKTCKSLQSVRPAGQPIIPEKTGKYRKFSPALTAVLSRPKCHTSPPAVLG